MEDPPGGSDAPAGLSGSLAGMARGGGRNRFPYSGRQVAALILVIVAMIFVLQNRRSTKVRFLIPELVTPLWVALFVSVLAGIIVGALIAYRRKD